MWPVFLAFILIALASSVRADELQICTTDTSPTVIVREHPDARIRSIFVEVLRKTAMKMSNFGLCEHDRLSTVTVGIEKSNGIYMIGVLVPSRARALSDDELEGLFAHEVAHVAIGMNRPNTLATEIAADAKGAEWVGVEKMLAMLRAAQRDLSRLPRVWTAEVQHELEDRILAFERNRI